MGIIDFCFYVFKSQNFKFQVRGDDCQASTDLHRSQFKPWQITSRKYRLLLIYNIHNPLQALTQAGIPRVKTECDRGGQTWHAREVKVPKCTEWMDIIGRTVIQV